MSDIIKLYNPANAASLTPEETEGLQKLTSEEIKQLAQAYPNGTFDKSYLLIVDGSKPVEKQIPTLSTFQNLWNLREKNGMKTWIAFGFKGNYQQKPINHINGRKTEVLDLSETELLSLPGFKVNGVQSATAKEFSNEDIRKEIVKQANELSLPPEVKVKKVRKTKIK